MKRKQAAAAVLVFIFVLVLMNSLHGIKKKGSPSARPPVPAAASGTRNLSEELVYVTNLRVNDKLREEQEKAWEKEWARDPFLPQATASAIVRAVNLTLNGVLWDDATPKAIVNEKTLLVGDTIYGYTVVDIKPRSVVLRTGEKNIELRVFRPVTAES